ncbi:LysR family transcriptional regulator [Sphingomonas jatrophae]|uniref:DNA-binding transcriptional regulator, LysR family n=1 Tax=Sphingomonas jatrophae TaxID=1166337 RepID=A0A1I6K244_9SPHN|nr:LysR family transcriptional regulator [Sphingomonas jatrophae]SFR85325.1 DNA-binding transcriptional regulator, LysR family [Sphingomonas jatrophae]
MLDRYLLRYAIAVVDQGNFSRAAAACNVSQPTLSVGIAKLERELGQQLFVRSNQRVELTDAGARFLPHARRIEAEFNVALQAMGRATDLPPLRLGVLGSLPAAIVAQAVAGTRPGEQHRFELLFGNERELAGHLAKGRIDLALTLVGRGAERFAERAVMSEGYSLALAADHPLADAGEIAPERLANEAMIVRRHCEALSETSRYFTERGVRPHFALRSTNDERVLDMVAAGLGLTVMPDCYAHADVRRPRLTGFDARRTIGWAAAHHGEHLLAAPLPLMTAVEQGLTVQHAPAADVAAP